MRLSTLALMATPALALPNYLRLSNGPSELASNLATHAISSTQAWLQDAVSNTRNSVQKGWKAVQDGLDQELKVENIDKDGIEYLALSHPAFPLHRLRVVKPELCDSSVKQLSGYLDISETRHLFFWFQESRQSPDEDPLVLWLNGGPGCSSTTGLLFELGGCNIRDKGENTTFNEYSWNSIANVLYLDQPIGVGYSYADEGEVNNSPAAAEDVYAFLVLFISKVMSMSPDVQLKANFFQFREYSELDFHIAGESYAGTYIPNIASVVHKNNIALDLVPTPSIPRINLKSVMIGNGLTDPYAQFGSVPDWACNSTYAPYDDPSPECDSLRTRASRCQGLISGCYKTNSRFTCVPAALYCWSMFNELQDLGLNMYDVRKTCDKSPEKDGPLCYREMGWMETYLNKPDVKKELGAPESVTFQSCNMQINQNFLLHGDGMHYAGGLLPDLVEDGIRVLVYAGQADMRKSCLPTSQIKWLTASMHQLSTTSDVLPSLITSRQAISLPTLLRPS
ncbi:cathepsin A (carboxypeptidase C) [Cryptococcus deuterogattii 99/473]|uniref:Carboxypeptidase n=1 Tax=Cryptococcus deuterogattii Ram5 TaxID=1296110 RepID=A0A0D0TQW8_9TREE|nr:cathepsin A (carboxypeptidase C) [Cryptococcus deuterogattii LA55]KIR35015.1 cathepsin A (carboxypeptidase C) [Cryptococcus deuterogattii MMRL2647]KIR37843.1 cathepsin A (carboxypeptidase C) [Cryptococcus deuterogattii Ram5]KIR70154.1 cathepsin A (carboxypeptidase C) [Cryptococcus deuterogattii CA1014]KIR93849.1 cathepsin A (carboxypeptidase C) [Cryptococcus deuterogattii CBS 10090]KIS00117.1 cathepsin A (carboxypeptidase C) [Cryptococcus deuterogattii 2001/935-1]KIY56723.1 cathepsin A (ca